MNPRWVTGFIDDEGSFSISITKNKDLKVGWRVKLIFQIELHRKDIVLLKNIKHSLGVGQIFKDGPNAIKFEVQSIKELIVIIDYFVLFGLIIQKRTDFELFKKILNLVQNKEYLTKEGLRKIIAIRASMNRGLSEKLKVAFPDVVPVERPLFELTQTIDPHWLAGFTSGEDHWETGWLRII